MTRVGFTHNLIKSEADFEKFAVRFNVLLFATLVSLALLHRLREYTEIVVSKSLEMEKSNFRSIMGWFAASMAITYIVADVVAALVKAMGLKKRVYEEDAMVFGFLTLACFLVHLFGSWGIIWLFVSPPIVFLGFKVAKHYLFRIVKVLVVSSLVVCITVFVIRAMIELAKSLVFY